MIPVGQLEADIVVGIFGLLGTFLTIAVPLVLPRVFDYMAAHKIMVDKQTQATIAADLHAALPRAIQYGENVALQKIDTKAVADTGNPAVNAAIDYLIENKGDALKALGVTQDVEADKIRQLLLAHVK